MSSLMRITIGDLLDKRAADRPDHEAVVYPHRNLRWTYAQFQKLCNQVALGLMALGIQKGDHVAIWATNYPEWLITQFATAKIGAVMVTVNTNYKEFELEYLLRQSDATTLILIDGFKDSNYIEHIYTLCPELKSAEPGNLKSSKFPYLKNIIYIGDKENPGMYNWNELYRLGSKIPVAELEKRRKSLNVHDVINMQYTSGTTGFPKGVMLTHYNITNNGNAIADSMKLTYRDRLCIPVPFFHCFGCVLGIMACISKGATIVSLDYFHPVRVMEAIEREKCTGIHGVPTIFISMLEHPDFNSFDFSSLRTGIMAGSPCPVKVMERVVNDMGAKEITIAYGQTESSPVITQTRTNDPIDLRVSTVGKALPNVEVKIIDVESGRDADVLQQGEIVTRGYHVMKGYYKMPEATTQVTDKDGWLHTGDLGVMDESGYLRITGRLRDMIIRGGENIYPREIEEFLYTHQAVKDVQVVGVPDKKYGEEVMAFIILKEEEVCSENEIIEFVKNGLSRYKAPRYVHFLDNYPMTASGKIQKYKLREMAIELLQLEDEASIETA
ncbi:MAG: AMP-binding protein [Clostridia bacterium]|jgi:fatty-acyl-CoA synthase